MPAEINRCLLTRTIDNLPKQYHSFPSRPNSPALPMNLRTIRTQGTMADIIMEEVMVAAGKICLPGVLWQDQDPF